MPEQHTTAPRPTQPLGPIPPTDDILERGLRSVLDNNLKDRPLAGQGRPYTSTAAVPLQRMAEALHRVQRLAEELERASDAIEKQLATVKASL